MNDSLDDYDFTPSSSTNLRSLFNTTIENLDNSSLTYTAPKQPKTGTTTEVKNETPKVDTSVICARVVQVWKLADGKYTAIGKLGFAIIGSSTQNSCEIILYKEKRNVIMRTKISSDFKISLKKDDFASFYDGTNENWLIKFSNKEDSNALASYIEKCGGKVATENLASAEKKEDAPKTLETVTDSDNKTRADILTRIAKMGQSILPNKNVDTEEETFEVEKPPVSVLINKSQEMTLTTMAPTNLVADRPVQNIPNTFMVTQPVSYDPLSLYVAENRAQNSELRMNLSQISEKLNNIMRCVDQGKSGNEVDNDALASRIKVLELRSENLLRELATAQQENSNLKLQLQQKNNDLKTEEENQRKVELLEEEMKEKVSSLQVQIMEYENSIEQQKNVVEQQNVELTDLQKQLERYRDEVKEIPTLESKIVELQQQLNDYDERQKSDGSSEVDKEKRANFTSMLKEEMNGLYSSVIENLNSEYQDVLAQNIKSATLRIIQTYQQMYD